MQDKFLKQNKVPKRERPVKPAKDLNYPTKFELALELIKKFKKCHPDIVVQAVIADALYGCCQFVNEAELIYKNTQIISQVKGVQKVKVNDEEISIEKYFQQQPVVERLIKVRGGAEKEVFVSGARLHLKAHGCKRFIIAIKYKREKKYRYLLASNLTWQLTNITSAYTFRWLVEVFIQDWKTHEGWCQLAKQPGVEGSSQGLILSLLSDHCLLLHSDQKALIKSKLPAATVGSLRDRERAKAILDSVEELINDEKVKGFVQQLKETIDKFIPLRKSSKHMSGRDIGRLGPTFSLEYVPT